jgi:ribosomal protein S18 acetylase RimI-like enzyme
MTATNQEPSIQLRTLDYGDVDEVRVYLGLLAQISAEGDEFHVARSEEDIDRAVLKARREEDESNTFAGIAVERRGPGRRGRQIVGLHVLRRFEEGPLVGAHIGGLWVHERCRRQGIARRLKAMGESWARSIGATFINTNVLVDNQRMLDFNRSLGFVDYRINLRKRL